MIFVACTHTEYCVHIADASLLTLRGVELMIICNNNNRGGECRRLFDSGKKLIPIITMLIRFFCRFLLSAELDSSWLRSESESMNGESHKYMVLPWNAASRLSSSSVHCATTMNSSNGNPIGIHIFRSE